MMNNISALSKASGLDKDTIRGIVKKVVENNKLLISCELHDFKGTPDRKIFKCANCSGTVDYIKKCWYELRLKHK